MNTVGVRPLTRAIARRDRTRLVAWILGIVVLVATSTFSLHGAYPTDESLQRYANSVGTSTAAVASQGPPYAIHTRGGQTAFEVALVAMVLIALMGLFLVIRNTRTDEETGRTDLVRSLPVAPLSPLLAALAVVIGGQVVVGALCMLIFVVSGLSFVGSLTLAAAITVAGVTFSGIAAVAAQLTQYARAALGIGGAIIGATFALRAVGDVQTEALAWLSPFGIAQRSRAFADERVWPLLLLLLMTAALVALAASLQHRRDVGSGLLAERRGPATASPVLHNPFMLALRLQRTAIISWTAAVGFIGLAYGSFVSSVEELAADNEAIQEFIARSGEGSLIDLYLSVTIAILALLAGIAATQCMLRLHDEETSGRLEIVNAAGATRRQLVVSQFAVAVIGGAVALIAGGASMGLTASAQQSSIGVLDTTGAALAYLPATTAMAGFALCVLGLTSRRAAAGWSAIGFSFMTVMFGDLLQLPSWTMTVSPYDHIPALPADTFDIGALVAVSLVSLVALALAGIGTWRFLQRDLG